MITAGIDLGSREVKLALLEDEKIIRLQKWGTLSFYRDFCYYDSGLHADLKKLGLNHFDYLVSTGYGRNNIDIEQFEPINELKAHVYGALFQIKQKDFTLLDIGGQDIKVMQIRNGILNDLVLNDKCAASCGRYLENMATVLEVPIEALGQYKENPVGLNSTCAVFSESELVGKIAEGVPFPQLCAGVNYSLYKRLRPLVVGFNPDCLVVSGGVSQNEALMHYLKKDCRELVILKEAQYNGAIGAAIFGQKQQGGQKKD